MSAYNAFISYSHAADGAFAPALQTALQRFAKPWFKLRELKVFRDGANLNLSPHLWASIEAALAQSEYFLCLASPQAAASKWVGQELAYWLAQRDRSKLLIIVTGGELAWDDVVNDFDWPRTTCLPRSVAGAFSGEPYFLDMRWAQATPDLSLQNPRFKEAVALLSATLHGKSVQDMVGEEVTQHRRTTLLRNGAVATLSVLLVLAVGAAWVAVRESAEARHQQAQAEQQRDRALASGLLNQVRAELASGGVGQAVRLARAAVAHLPGQPPAQQAAAEVASDDSAVLLTLREPLDSKPQVAFSPDGKLILSLAAGLQSALDARVRDLAGRELLVFNSVRSAAFAAAGQRLLVQRPGAPMMQQQGDGSCSEVDDYTLENLLDLGAPGPRPRPESLHSFGLQGFSPDARRVAYVCGNTVIHGELDNRGTQDFRAPGVSAAQVASDGQRLALVTPLGTRLVNAQGVTLATLRGTQPMFAADGSALATVQAGYTLVWAAHGTLLARHEGVAPVFGPGGMVITQQGSASVLWRTGQPPLRLAGTAARISPDGQWVMTTVDGQRTRVADVAGNELALLDGVSGQFWPSGPLALTAGANGLVRLWDLRRLPATTLAAAARLWGVPAAELAALAPAPGAGDGGASCTEGCATPDPHTRVWIGAHGVTPGRPFTASLRLHRVERGTPPGGAALRVNEAGGGDRHDCQMPLAPLVFSPAPGHDLALGCGEGIVRVLSLAGQMKWQARHDGGVTRLRFSRHGEHLVTTSVDRTARLWRADTGAALATLAGHDSEVTDAVFAAHGQRIATLTSRGTLRLWLADGTLLARIAVPGDAIVAAAFSTDGRFVLARTAGGSWRRWLAGPAQLAQEFAGLGELSAAQRNELGLLQ